jgi:hypothetical protein
MEDLNMALKETKTPQVGFSLAAEIARRFMQDKRNVMFTGIPGIGKTALMKLIAKELGYNLILFHPVVSDPTDFKGLPWCFVDENGNRQAVFVPFDQLEALINATGPTICGLDDFGQAPDAVQASCMQLLHGGELCGKKISEHVRFMACTNRKQDKAGVKSLLEPVKSRFHGIFELIPELEPWLTYAATIGMSPMLMAFMRHMPQYLQGGDDGWQPEADIVNQPCPRTIEHLSDVINMGFDKATRRTVYAGAVGQGMGNAYAAFEDLALRMPDLDDICQNPRGADADLSPDISYAMIGALHTRMDRNNIDNIYIYIDRAFTKELQAVFHFDIKKIKPSLVKTQAYIAFAAANGDLFTN